MRGLSTLKLLLATILATGAILAATAVPASAHRLQVNLFVGGTKLGHGVVSLEHIHIATCDTNADGVGIRTYYERASGAVGFVEDANGANAGCTNVPVATHANPVVWIRVCTNNLNTCTPWTGA